LAIGHADTFVFIIKNRSSKKSKVMKKVFVTMLVAALGTAAFATNGDPINTRAILTFNQLFAAATEVAWAPVEETDLVKANFMYNGEQAEAYFNSEGEMVAAGRYIGLKQLPMAVIRQIDQKYAGYAVSPKVIEYETNGETAYVVTLVGDKQDLVVKATAGGALSLQKKLKKK
jgi:hypothetical protein